LADGRDAEHDAGGDSYFPEQGGSDARLGASHPRSHFRLYRCPRFSHRLRGNSKFFLNIAKSKQLKKIKLGGTRQFK